MPDKQQEAQATNGSSGPKLLGRDEILRAEDFKWEDVRVPEWGGTVRVKSLTGDERDMFEAQIRETRRDGSFKSNFAKMRVKLLALTIVDGNNRRLFSPEDVTSLGKKSAAAIQRVWDCASRLSGLSQEDAEELARGLEEDPNEGRTSAGQ